MKRLFFLCIALLSVSCALAQGPVQWKTAVQKTRDGQYELQLKATVGYGWHIYSQFTPEGGPVPSEIEIRKNPLLVLEGAVAERGEMVKKREEVFGIDVQYFNKEVVFVQKFSRRAKAKTNISGSFKYMVCNDRECLPSKTYSFDVTVD